jgi:hypothetical protein
VKPFAQVTRGGTIPVWPTFNLYAGSEMSPFRSAQSKHADCTNTVISVFTTAQPVPHEQGMYVPPFSGGVWQYPNTTAPGCTASPTDVNWGDGDTKKSFAQNVFLNVHFPTR